MSKKLLLLIPLLLAGCDLAAGAAPSRPTYTPMPYTSVAYCDIPGMAGAVTWIETSGEMAGTIDLINTAEKPCRIKGRPQVVVNDETGHTLYVQLEDLPSANPDAVIEVPAGGTVRARFRWTNWCGDAPSGSITFTVSLLGYPGELPIAVQDPNGQPLSGAPACTMPDHPAAFATEPLARGE